MMVMMLLLLLLKCIDRFTTPISISAVSIRGGAPWLEVPQVIYFVTEMALAADGTAPYGGAARCRVQHAVLNGSRINRNGSLDRVDDPTDPNRSP